MTFKEPELESLSIALELFNTVKKMIDGNGDLGGRFRTRARNIPSLMVRDGLPVTLIYLLSKGSFKKIKEVSLNKSFFDYINFENKSETDSYSLYLALVMEALSKLGLRIKKLNSMRDTVLELCYELKKIHLSIMYEETLSEVLVHVKRLAESYYKEKS